MSIKADDLLNTPEEELEFREALYRYREQGPLTSDELTREITITPFDGNYGRAGLIITINGSPPQGYGYLRGNTFRSLDHRCLES